jgi:hypothetical protein
MTFRIFGVPSDAPQTGVQVQSIIAAVIRRESGESYIRGCTLATLRLQKLRSD